MMAPLSFAQHTSYNIHLLLLLFFLSDPGRPGPIYVSGCLKLTKWLSYVVWNFTDVTLADEDTNSILTDKVNRTIQGNVAMQL